MPRHRTAQPRTTRRGFTLIEMLVTVAIAATLFSLLLPSLGMTIRSARAFRCQVSLRSIAFDFTVFADDQLHGDRGNDPGFVGQGRFRLETFQESQYGVDEFWPWGTAPVHVFPDAAKNDPMRCPEVRGALTVVNGTPCGQGAIGPARSVSYGFNLRLHQAPTVAPGGQSGIVPVVLTGAILHAGRVPLAWDVDGALAESRDLTPVFSAPSLHDTPVYGNDWYWFPSLRHGGADNFAFIDGSVESSRSPLTHAGWRWEFNPVR
jgi:prepilin-type N-terminal cleavage/methylation domain-containing protein/prepilin-type processing-associated H-X9-DG protein